MYGIVLMIIIAGTIGSTLSGSTQAVSTVAMLALWRLFLGIGVGGDYPLSGVITSEFANSKHRGLMIAAVFAMQGVGIMASTVVAVIVLAAFKQQILENPVYYLDLVWRLCIGVGAIPALIAVYFRLQIPESPRFSADVLGNTEKALADANQVVAENANNRLLAQVNTYNDSYERKPLPSNNNIGVVSQGPSFTEFFGQWKNLKVLIGASVTWFALGKIHNRKR